jgi:hypothetical protein
VQVGLIEVPVGFAVAMSCVMGILNVRYMKREMEDSVEGREKSIFHLPFATNPRERTPSMVDFARAPMTPLSPDSQSEFEYVEMRSMGNNSTPQRHAVTI